MFIKYGRYQIIIELVLNHLKNNLGLNFEILAYNQYVKLQSCSRCNVCNLGKLISFLKMLSKNNPSGGYYYNLVSQSKSPCSKWPSQNIFKF